MKPLIDADILLKDFKQLSHYYNSLMGGDTHLIEDAYKLLQSYSLVDEDGFEIEEEE